MSVPDHWLGVTAGRIGDPVDSSSLGDTSNWFGDTWHRCPTNRPPSPSRPMPSHESTVIAPSGGSSSHRFPCSCSSHSPLRSSFTLLKSDTASGADRAVAGGDHGVLVPRPQYLQHATDQRAYGSGAKRGSWTCIDPFTHLHCVPESLAVSTASVRCTFDPQNDPRVGNTGDTFWSVYLERSSSGRWLVTDWGQP